MPSSGTTGKPKCIVHSAGGVLLKHLASWFIQMQRKEKVFILQCGWMM